MNLNWGKMSVEEIGAVICSHLKKNGLDVVLSGGACVTIYSNNQYESRDLDFVSDDSLNRLDPMMAELGFARKGQQRHYENSKCPYFVEFPPSPLTVGEEFVRKTAIIKNKFGRLRLLRPADSVKDRLAAFYHWNDRQSLDQAVMICKTKRIDLREIRQWSKKEGALLQYQYFIKSLRKKGRKD